MAEQDRYGSHLGVDPKKLSDKLPDKSSFHGVSGAEQDRYGAHLGGKGVDAKDLPDRSWFKNSSGSEQDRYASHLGGGIDPKNLPDKSSFAGSSGAEQDRYGSHFGGYGVDAKDLPDRSSFRGSSGAEQDRYGSHFGGFGINKKDLPDAASFKGASGAEQDRYGSKLGVNQDRLNIFSGRKNSKGSGLARFGKNSGSDNNYSLNTSTVGILQSTIIPSLGFHSGLSVVAYAAARASNRLVVKDYLWPSAQVLNAWWSAVGIPVVYHSVPIATALSSLTYTQQLLLGGVTVWGLRLLYRVVGRGVARGGDDPRYESVKKEPGFWNNALLKVFLPEAIFQTLITLPFTVPFRAPWSSAAASPNLPVSAELVHGLAVFLFSAGFATEILADSQLASHQKHDKADLNRAGVWSIVRHPNYLGNTLVHASFPLLLAGAGLMHPITLLGPAANYIFVRYFSSDKENEGNQDLRYRTENPLKFEQLQVYKVEKNSFWPKLSELKNLWLWIVGGAGVGGVVLEQGFRRYFYRS